MASSVYLNKQRMLKKSEDDAKQKSSVLSTGVNGNNERNPKRRAAVQVIKETVLQATDETETAEEMVLLSSADMKNAVSSNDIQVIKDTVIEIVHEASSSVVVENENLTVNTLDKDVEVIKETMVKMIDESEKTQEMVHEAISSVADMKKTMNQLVGTVEGIQSNYKELAQDLVNSKRSALSPREKCKKIISALPKETTLSAICVDIGWPTTQNV